MLSTQDTTWGLNSLDLVRTSVVCVGKVVSILVSVLGCPVVDEQDGGPQLPFLLLLPHVLYDFIVHNDELPGTLLLR